VRAVRPRDIARAFFALTFARATGDYAVARFVLAALDRLCFSHSFFAAVPRRRSPPPFSPSPAASSTHCYADSSN
jgi:hypothetical protein